ARLGPARAAARGRDPPARRRRRPAERARDPGAFIADEHADLHARLGGAPPVRLSAGAPPRVSTRWTTARSARPRHPVTGLPAKFARPLADGPPRGAHSSVRGHHCRGACARAPGPNRTRRSTRTGARAGRGHRYGTGRHHAAAAGERRSLRSPDAALESEDEAVYSR